MKPKTEIQKKIVALSNTLKCLTRSQKDWAYKRCYEHTAVWSRKKLYCIECGHEWKDESFDFDTMAKTTCPKCGKKVKVEVLAKIIYRDNAYVAKMECVDEYQVVRMFLVTKYSKKGKKAEFGINEVMRHFIDQKGGLHSLSLTVQGLSQYYDTWIFGSKLEFRCKTYNADLRASLIPYRIFPRGQFQPILYRNGFYGKFLDVSPVRLFTNILSEPKAETLLKANQILLFQYFIYRGKQKIEEYWDTIKICMRNNFFIEDHVDEASDYFDYLYMLSEFGKDLRNPKFVCPEDISDEHDKLEARLRAIRERENEEKRRIAEEQRIRRAEEGMRKFKEHISKFMDLVITDGEIVIRPLKTIDEFKKEGDALNHCIYESAYYAETNSLILSARKGRKRLETVEFSIPNMEVVQARGMDNQPTKDHEHIVRIVNRNRKLIAKCVGA